MDVEPMLLQQVTTTFFANLGTIGSSGNVAAFDLDGTLVRSIHGKLFKDENDWAFLPNRIEVLKGFRDAGYTLAIFTNQKYKGLKVYSAIKRVTNIFNFLLDNDLNVNFFAATGDDIYRKPNIGMWNSFIQYVPNFNSISSFYVRDTAGRPQDYSDAEIDYLHKILELSSILQKKYFLLMKLIFQIINQCSYLLVCRDQERLPSLKRN